MQDDVDEALRLIEASKESLYQDQGGYGRDLSPSSRIYNMVRALAESGQCRPDDADEDEEEGANDGGEGGGSEEDLSSSGEE